MVSSYWEKRREKEEKEVKKKCPVCNSTRTEIFMGNLQCRKCGYILKKYFNVNY